MADPLPSGKGFLELAWEARFPLLLAFVVGALVGRFAGALFGL